MNGELTSFQDAHMGWLYLNYTDGWPVAVQTEDSSNAGSLHSLPRWSYWMILMSMWSSQVFLKCGVAK
jgi:hypothetical protein